MDGNHRIHGACHYSEIASFTQILPFPRGAFRNYFDKCVDFSYHLPIPCWHWQRLSFNFIRKNPDKVEISSCTFYLPHLVNVVCERPLDLFERLDSALPYPMTVRLSRTVNIMLYLIHLTGCSYYAFSDYNVGIRYQNWIGFHRLLSFFPRVLLL